MFYCFLEGTTKRKELHGTTGVHALSGTWASERTAVKLQSYKLKFSCDQVGQRYSDFVLLIDTTIENEAANLDIDLYLHDKMVKASVSPYGLLELDVEQVCSSLSYVLATFVAPSLLYSNL
jgi:endoribonuclease Dicer